MGIHVIQSQRIDVLLQGVLTTVGQPRSNPFAVLQAQHFIVPSKAVETWLTLQLAEHHGISANTQFHQRIRGFQWAAYQAVLHEQKERVRKANIPRIIIKWRVFQLLKDFIERENTLSKDHALYPIVQRIYASADQLAPGLEQQLKRQRMLYWVAEQVSKLFSNYMVYRGHCQKNCPAGQCNCPSNWLQAWGQDQELPLEDLFLKTNSEVSEFTMNQARELEGWQRWLWQQVFHQDFQEMQQIDQLFWQILENPDTQQQALEKLPQQLVVFTLLDLPPSQLQFLRQLGQYLDIYILHYNPSQEYWADTVDPHWKARYDVRVKERFIEKNPAATDAQIAQFFAGFTLKFDAQARESRHPLLTRFGKQARDHFSLLSSLSSGEDGVWADAFVDDYAPTLLGKIQSDILYLAEPEPQQYVLQPQDDSIQIHVCHSSLRQLEVLKDQLLHWLSQGSKEQPRRPSDILVLSPNLQDMEPLIRSVFAPPPSERDVSRPNEQHQQRLSQDSVYLPIQIAGVPQLDASNAWRAVLGRIQLMQGRFNIEEFSDWLSLDATLQRYELEISQVERMLELLTAAGFKRGFDAEHLQRSLTAGDDDYRFTFKFALDRLALGIAIPEHTLFHDTLSFAQVVQGDFALITKLIEIYQDFSLRRHWLIAHELGETLRAEHWLQRLMDDINQFVEKGVEALSSVYQIVKKHERMLTLASFYDEQNQHALQVLTLPLPYLIEEITAQLDAQLEQAEPTGQITFSQIGQIRPLPYKLIVMLNLDSGKFPNRNTQVPFDLMQILRPQLGDRSRLEDDQGAFLDALLLAQQNLWLFYNGFDVNDGEVRDPSTVLQELIQHMETIVAPAVDAPQHSPKISYHGIKLHAALKSLYQVHAMQPFDPVGFTDTTTIRYQDQWFKVAKTLQHAQGSRQGWSSTPFVRQASVQNIQDMQVLPSSQWIQDVIFPARAYLKNLGVKNLSVEDVAPQQEPLLLDPLQQYTVRDFLLQHEQLEESHAPELLSDVLPIGKTKEATWQVSMLEQNNLLERLHVFATEPTPTTQTTLQLNAHLQLAISIPAQSTTQWVSVLASSASAKRVAQVWLESLLWLAHLDLGEGGSDYLRIVVCRNKTIICEQVSSQQAQQWLEAWYGAWNYAQQQPLVLPAELLLKVKAESKTKRHEWQADEQGQMLLGDSDLQGIIAEWENSYSNSVPVEDMPARKYHRDWQFILQEQDSKQLLKQACEQFSYALYAPVFDHLRLEEP